MQLMNYSSPLSMTTVPGCFWIQDRNRFTLFGANGLSKDVWKLGYVLGTFGITVVYAEQVGRHL